MVKIGKNEPCICGSGRKYKRCCGGSSAKDNSQYRQMPRHEFWRLRYRARRYLEHLSNEDLAQRHNDILKNLTLLTDELKIGFQRMDEEGQYWAEIHTHLLEECSLRGFNVVSNLLKDKNNNPFPQYDLKGLDKAINKFTRLNLQTGKYLVKYGQKKYLEPMLKKGTVRIMPAASYSDPSLNSAIRDNELETSRLILPNEVQFENFYENIEVSVGGKKGRLGDFAEFVGNSKFTLVSNVNFYVYCLTYEHSFRMFGDFEADCCLVVKKPTEFLEKIFTEFSKVKHNYSLYHQIVKYFDPLNVGKINLPFYFSKHFGYAYQKEYRIVWLPPEKTMELEPIFLELGNLEDCCEIIELDTN